MVEVDEIQRTEFYLLLALQDGFDTFALFGRNERHGILRTQAQMAGTVVRRQPEFDLGPIGGVSPMTRQNETLLMPGQIPTLESPFLPLILVGARGIRTKRSSVGLHRQAFLKAVAQSECIFMRLLS